MSDNGSQPKSGLSASSDNPSTPSDQASRRRRGGERRDAAEPRDPRPGNTDHYSSHISNNYTGLDDSVVAIDWLETAGVVAWGSNSENENVVLLQTALENAKAARSPVPLTLNGFQCLLHPKGMGRGRQSFLAFRITCGEVTIAFDLRDNASRSFNNYSLTIPGGPCVIQGAMAVRQWAAEVVSAFGGNIADEWIRRIDLCVDLPGIDPRETLFPALLQNQFTSTSDNSSFNYNCKEPNTFTLTSKQRLTLQIYDKLLEVQQKNNPLYLEAMKQTRWGGQIPKAATRVELRIYRSWLGQWEINYADGILESLRSVVEKVLPESGKAFFRMLDREPDRKNKHQSRCQTHPLWAKIRSLLINKSGGEPLEFRRIARRQMSHRRSFQVIKSMLLRTAVDRGEKIRGIRSAQELLKQLSYLSEVNDHVWFSDWKQKASEAGLYDPAVEFDFGLNAEPF